MATAADVRLYKALQEESRAVEEQQRKIMEQNRKASLWSGIGKTLGSILGAAVTGGNPLGAAAGARLFSEIGEQAAGGYEGGTIEGGKFFAEDIRRQNAVLDQYLADQPQTETTGNVTPYRTAGEGTLPY